MKQQFRQLAEYKATIITPTYPTACKIRLHVMTRAVGATFKQYVNERTGDIFLKRVDPIDFSEEIESL